ncbi:MAG: Helix-turn-helix domain [Verrucomicrobiota bacterium]
MHIESMGQITGQDLKQIRESKGLTLEEAARETCLRAGMLRELEESAGFDTLPEVYQNLSLRMYARYLGLEVEPVRQPVREKAKTRITPVTNFIRRMGRPPKPPRLDRNQRTKLLTLAKTTSAAIVTVLAVGFWSLNAKLSRLNFDEKSVELVPAKHVAAQTTKLDLYSENPTEPQHVVLDSSCALSLEQGSGAPQAGQP